MINVIITVIKYNMHSKAASKKPKEDYHIAVGKCRKKKSIDYDVM